MINSILNCVLQEHSLQRKTGRSSRSSSLSIRASHKRHAGTMTCWGNGYVLHQCQKGHSHVKAPKSLLQITTNTHISQGIKLILLIEDLVSMDWMHSNGFPWGWIFFWFITITAVQVKIESTLPRDAQACMPSSTNCVHCVQKILQHRSECRQCVQCHLTFQAPVAFFFLLPLHCKCSHLITHVRKMWFKMFESDVYFGWMSRSIINLQGTLTALCRGSESSLQVCWKLTIFQHFSPATPTTWHLSREEEDRRQMFCQGK